MATERESRPPTEAVARQQAKVLRDALVKYVPTIDKMLPKEWGGADRFVRVAFVATNGQPKLLECEPVSFCKAVLMSAMLGLDPSGTTGEAYLIPRWSGKKQRLEATFMTGYRGLVKLAKQSKEVKAVEAQVVCENDTFDHALGTQPYLIHKRALKDPGKPILAYAIWTLRDGTKQFDIMTTEEIEEIRQRSESGKKARPIAFMSDQEEAEFRRTAKPEQMTPWTTDWPEMAKKSVVRRSHKLMPVSTETRMAVDAEERQERGEEIDTVIVRQAQEKGMLEIMTGPVLEEEPPQEKKPEQTPGKAASNEEPKKEAAPEPVILITEQQRKDFWALARSNQRSAKDIEEFLQTMFGDPRPEAIKVIDYQDAMKWAGMEPEEWRKA
jgi:recombination protein RecT